MVGVSEASPEDDLKSLALGALGSKLEEFATHIGLSGVSASAPVMHEYRGLFDEVLDQVLSVTTEPEALRKGVAVIGESVANLAGMPWLAARAFGCVAGELVKPGARQVQWTPDLIGAAATEAFLIVDSAMCARNGVLAVCPSVEILIGVFGDSVVAAKLDSIMESLTISGRQFTPQSSQLASNVRKRSTTRVPWTPFAPVAGDPDFDPAAAAVAVVRRTGRREDRSGLAGIPAGFVRQLTDLLDAGEWPDDRKRDRARVISGYLRHQLDSGRKRASA
ncbi:hypothetical protein [Stackebrandtia nassauensis]|uniref:Uncharacterized protein n=1 Tax=Stackebrandtia nassauensis (strain DSM 44728 / CIP 108903 / NRRL B-16338 / NBRC 102104 / LLR-40K-21) TaxID=446470 RepID=D3QB07_STANL|nr:hypothetical protein [Stackebrandtia nassauensis]ADD40824.1 hypothetical protein Snas_1114 [Stackebrandtia nassauensis DSM 44728]